MQQEQYRVLRDKVQQENNDKRTISLEQMLLPNQGTFVVAANLIGVSGKSAEKQRQADAIPDEAIPVGQGESFKPGEWIPTPKSR